MIHALRRADAAYLAGKYIYSVGW